METAPSGKTTISVLQIRDWLSDALEWEKMKASCSIVACLNSLCANKLSDIKRLSEEGGQVQFKNSEMLL